MAPRPLKATTISGEVDRKQYTLTPLKSFRAAVVPTAPFPPLKCPLRNRFGGRQSFLKTMRYSKQELTEQRNRPLSCRFPGAIANEAAFEKISSRSSSPISVIELLSSTSEESLSVPSKATPQITLLRRQFGQIQSIINEKKTEDASISRFKPVTSLTKLLSSTSEESLSAPQKSTVERSPLLNRQLGQINTIIKNQGSNNVPRPRNNSVNSLTNLLSSTSVSSSMISVAEIDDDLSKASYRKRVDFYDLKTSYRLTYEEMFSGRRVDTYFGPGSFCYVCHIAFEIKVLLYHHCERQHGEQFRIPPAVMGQA
jgi:hypothetical protein